MRLDFSDQVVLLTGGSRGIGRGISEAFLKVGARVEICGRSSPREVPKVGFNRAHFSEIDVRDPLAVEAWVNDVHHRQGSINIAINNVGGSPFGAFEKGSPGYLKAVMELNFFSAAYIARAVHP